MKSLVDKVELRNKAILNDRIVMAPMVTFSGNEDGTITDEQLDYYSVRSEVGGMIIAETMYINNEGVAFKGELGICDDRHMPGLKKLTAIIKQNGSKAIAQLHHGGREAGVYFDRGGIPVAPSKIDFPFLDYPVKELSHPEIIEIIKEYGLATKRAIDAGFDGVEIHGANHYLIQQFFSAYSNLRTDEYGGNLEKRARFLIDITKEVISVAKEYARPDFIIGIRISQEEKHGEKVGFDFNDNVKLIHLLNDFRLDYLHISAMGDSQDGYKAKPTDSEKTFGEIYRNVLDHKIKLVLCGCILTESDAQDAISIGDLAGIAREALLEPEFAKKIHEGRSSEIFSEISPERLSIVKWPKGLEYMIIKDLKKGNQTQHGYNTSVPLPNVESIR
ncbi:hypothetical protein [Brenneria tiliae]|uniref:NADH:flavin oxidoreductase/NADH oxidase N-terminal domain-containing protein n=1 Tax=Brenneria tiliae TaxID=2914984 RepID=A0ABT0MV84_9GAMM|nr:hypothetical protein [Brenneria tiliae]MCL2893744.1 hypothetical protein [Brenneria tiliae]